MTETATRKPDGTRPRFGLVAGMLLMLVAACTQAPSATEDGVRDWVQRGVAAAEARERRKLVSMISPAYADARGNGRDGIERLLRAYFTRMHTVELMTSVEEIEIIGDTAAEVMLKVGMAGTHDGVFGFSADAYRFALEVEHDGADWQLISARWGQWGKELK